MSKYWHVAPRYTAGSPATVSGLVAKQVAREEMDFYQHALRGVWGVEWREKAEKLGLAGIVEIHDVRSHHVVKTDYILEHLFKEWAPYS